MLRPRVVSPHVACCLRLRRCAAAATCSSCSFSCCQGAYFIGKAVWGKGYRELINLGAEYEQVGSDTMRDRPPACALLRRAHGLAAAQPRPALSVAASKNACSVAPRMQVSPEPLVLDVIGAGEDLGAIQTAAADKGLAWNWLGAKDHGDASMHEYQVRVPCGAVVMWAGVVATDCRLLVL